MEGARRPLPSGHDNRRGKPPADPDVPARILEQTRDIVTREAIAGRIDRSRPDASEVLDVPHFRKAVQSGAARYPPLARAILKGQAGIDRFGDVVGQMRSNRRETGAIESVDTLVVADDEELSRRVLEHGANASVGEAVSLRIGGEPVAGKSQRAIG